MRHRATGRFYALKILKKKEIIRLKQLEHILSEKGILAIVEHPFVVNLCAHPGSPALLLEEGDWMGGGVRDVLPRAAAGNALLLCCRQRRRCAPLRRSPRLPALTSPLSSCHSLPPPASRPVWPTPPPESARA